MSCWFYWFFMISKRFCFYCTISLYSFLSVIFATFHNFPDYLWMFLFISTFYDEVLCIVVILLLLTALFFFCLCLPELVIKWLQWEKWLLNNWNFIFVSPCRCETEKSVTWYEKSWLFSEVNCVCSKCITIPMDVISFFFPRNTLIHPFHINGNLGVN